MSQKYSMILVNRVILDNGEIHDVCRIVKALHDSDSLNAADITEVPLRTKDDLLSAAKDVLENDVNTWHYDNGKFSIDENGDLTWGATEKVKPDHATEEPSAVQSEDELYAVYGGD